MATSTVGPSKDYATVTAWEAAKQGTLSGVETASVYNNSGGAYTDQPTIDGSTTDASNHMRVECATGEEFGGDCASPSGVYWDPNTSGHVFQIGDGYVELDGFGITNSTPASSDEGIRINAGGDNFTANALSIFGFSQADGDGLYVGNMDWTGTFTNCQFVEIHRAGIHLQHYSGGPFTQNLNVYNCSFSRMGYNGGGTREGCAVGYRCTNNSSVQNIKIKNSTCVWPQGSETYSVRQTNSSSNGTTNVTGDYNADEQANQAASGFPDDASNSLFNQTAQRGSDLTTETSSYLVFVSYYDLHVEDDSAETWTNALLGAGVGPSSDSDIPTSDADGDSRSGTTADIGFDEFASGASSQNLTDNGVTSSASVGQETLTVGAVSLTDSGVSSSAAVGQETLTAGAVSLADSGVASGVAVGMETLAVGAATLTDSAVSSSAAVGTETLATGSVSLTDSGVASLESVGVETIALGGTTLVDAGVPSGEAVGTETITVGAVSLVDAGISAGVSVGLETVAAAAISLVDVAVSSSESVGFETLAVGAVTIVDIAIASTVSVGQEQVGDIITVPVPVEGLAILTEAVDGDAALAEAVAGLAELLSTKDVVLQMTTRNWDKEMHQADSKDWLFTVTDENGSAVDLSSVASGAIKYVVSTTFSPEGDYPASPFEIEHSNASSAQIEVTDAVNGQFKVHLAPADTETVTPTTYYHACRLYVSGSSYTLAVGTLRIRKSLQMVHS